MGLSLIVGEGNFLIARLPGSDTLAYRKLMREGVMIRPMTGFRYPNHIRITLAQDGGHGGRGRRTEKNPALKENILA